MKVRVIRKFYDATTKKPYKLRMPGETLSLKDARAKELIDGYFVVPLEKKVEQPKGEPLTETKNDNSE